ncbi:hypothetical protein [Spirosoma sp. KNUC1025]|uniref:hypothetical protein n=1 Tax=Spirosoma sp. KNUC1025 TaxID=2894082 RepID=UPI00386632F1|nr:hypothetical protein LN737_19070 [Spirosoma sp. KNUC1025]
MLSYIELVNRFWQVDEQYNFSGNETRLYFYLLKVANALGWPDEFDYADSKLSGNLGQRVNTLKPCRDRLIQAGLLDFVPGGKGQANRVRYQLRYQNLTPKEGLRCQVSYQKLTPTLTPNEALVSDKLSKIDTYSYIKETKTFSDSKTGAENSKTSVDETKEKAPSPPTPTPPTPPPDLPFGEAFAEAWSLWLRYRSERRLPAYKPIGLKGALTDLLTLSGNDEAHAIELIHHAIAKNWQGIYPIKNTNGHVATNRTAQHPTRNRIQQTAEPYAFDLARALANNAAHNGHPDQPGDDFTAFEFAE